jgi:hypothetical protein
MSSAYWLSVCPYEQKEKIVLAAMTYLVVCYVFTLYCYMNRAEQCMIQDLHTASLSSVHVFRDTEITPQKTQLCIK